MTRSVCSWLMLAGIVTRTSARRFPSESNWKPSAPTATAAGTGGPDRWSHLQVSHRPTDAPRLELRADENVKRSHIGTETCGFYPEDGLAMFCPAGSTCLNIGNYRDCCIADDCRTSSFSSVCLNYNDPGCAAHTDGTTCCNANADRPYCATYIWSTTATPNRIFTLFNCDDKIFSGQAILDAEPRTTVGSSSVTTSSTTSSTPPASSTANSSPATSSTPVGAIVGGVIGGLVVIGLVVLGVFWMFFRNRRAADRGSYVAAAKAEPGGGSPGDSSPAVANAPVGYNPGYTDTAAFPPPGSSVSPPPVTVSPLSGGTASPTPHHAISPETKPHIEVATSPMSKEMPTSPSFKEMPTSPAFKEMMTGPRASELPTYKTAELPG